MAARWNGYYILFPLLLSIFVYADDKLTIKLCGDADCTAPIGKGFALQNFPAGSEDELSLKVKDEVSILAKFTGTLESKLLAKVNDKIGLVPKSLVKETNTFKKTEELLKIPYLEKKEEAQADDAADATDQTVDSSDIEEETSSSSFVTPSEVLETGSKLHMSQTTQTEDAHVQIQPTQTRSIETAATKGCVVDGTPFLDEEVCRTESELSSEATLSPSVSYTESPLQSEDSLVTGSTENNEAIQTDEKDDRHVDKLTTAFDTELSSRVQVSPTVTSEGYSTGTVLSNQETQGMNDIGNHSEADNSSLSDSNAADLPDKTDASQESEAPSAKVEKSADSSTTLPMSGGSTAEDESVEDKSLLSHTLASEQSPHTEQTEDVPLETASLFDKTAADFFNESEKDVSTHVDSSNQTVPDKDQSESSETVTVLPSLSDAIVPESSSTVPLSSASLDSVTESEPVASPADSGKMIESDLPQTSLKVTESSLVESAQVNQSISEDKNIEKLHTKISPSSSTQETLQTMVDEKEELSNKLSEITMKDESEELSNKLSETTMKDDSKTMLDIEPSVSIGDTSVPFSQESIQPSFSEPVAKSSDVNSDSIASVDISIHTAEVAISSEAVEDYGTPELSGDPISSSESDLLSHVFDSSQVILQTADVTTEAQESLEMPPPVADDDDVSPPDTTISSSLDVNDSENLSERKQESLLTKTEDKSSDSLEDIMQDYVNMVRKYVQFTVDMLPEPVHSAVVDLELQGISPRVTVFTVIAGMFTCFIIIIYSVLMKNRKEGKYLAEISSLEQKLFTMTTERNILKNESQTAKQQVLFQHKSLEEHQIMVKKLQEDLDEVQKANSVLESQLDSATEAGLELNQMLSSLLTSQKNNQDLETMVVKLEEKWEAQKELLDQYQGDVTLKQKENEDLRMKLQQVTSTVDNLETQLKQVEDRYFDKCQESEEMKSTMGLCEEQISTLRATKAQLLLEAETWNERVKELTAKVEEYAADISKLHRSLQDRDAENEILQNNIKELKLIEDLASESEDKPEEAEKRLHQLMDVGQMRLEYQKIKEQNEVLEETITEKQNSLQTKEEELATVSEEVKKLTENYNKALNEKIEAENKLQVLKNYFTDRELQLQKEIVYQEEQRGKTDSNATSMTQQKMLLEKENAAYKSQLVTLKQELEVSERNYKNQIVEQEKRAHENWLAARAAERKLEDLNKDMTSLRQRLTYVEHEKESLLQSASARFAGTSLESVLHPPDSVLNSSSSANDTQDGIKPPTRPTPLLPLDRPLPPPPLHPLDLPPLPPPPMFPPPPGSRPFLPDAFHPLDPWRMPPPPPHLVSQPELKRHLKSPSYGRGSPASLRGEVISEPYSPPPYSRDSRSSSPPPLPRFYDHPPMHRGPPFPPPPPYSMRPHLPPPGHHGSPAHDPRDHGHSDSRSVRSMPRPSPQPSSDNRKNGSTTAV